MTGEPTTTQPHWSADNDLTAKARIRNAAFELHATKGEANATIREVAQAAGVTHGLVVHHFANKAGLRQAVQQHMVDLLRQALATVPTTGTATEVGQARDAAVARMYDEHPAFLRYLRRAIVDPSHLDVELLDILADFTLNQIRELRTAGVATSSAPEPTQVLSILLRELAPRLLEPVVHELWSHLTGGSAEPPPNLDVRVAPTTAPSSTPD